ncbi:TKL kinase [Raphidocelis subcapitata]|uniref:TKL kinase n=1 Tax=Raphidocelis subcapitata TaxID=307507 RepID=A0A2V0P5U6_9CHLO|nr:TKL kinase [Raphidocelis subcapitata]|eukprot:GBF95241.1 TKL kinase [Raphidocelis subcapitata]
MLGCLRASCSELGCDADALLCPDARWKEGSDVEGGGAAAPSPTVAPPWAMLPSLLDELSTGAQGVPIQALARASRTKMAALRASWRAVAAARGAAASRAAGDAAAAHAPQGPSLSDQGLPWWQVMACDVTQPRVDEAQQARPVLGPRQAPSDGGAKLQAALPPAATDVAPAAPAAARAADVMQERGQAGAVTPAARLLAAAAAAPQQPPPLGPARATKPQPSQQHQKQQQSQAVPVPRLPSAAPQLDMQEVDQQRPRASSRLPSHQGIEGMQGPCPPQLPQQQQQQQQQEQQQQQQDKQAQATAWEAGASAAAGQLVDTQPPVQAAQREQRLLQEQSRAAGPHQQQPPQPQQPQQPQQQQQQPQQQQQQPPPPQQQQQQQPHQQEPHHQEQRPETPPAQPKGRHDQLDDAINGAAALAAPAPAMPPATAGTAAAAAATTGVNGGSVARTQAQARLQLLEDDQGQGSARKAQLAWGEPLAAVAGEPLRPVTPLRRLGALPDDVVSGVSLQTAAADLPGGAAFKQLARQPARLAASQLPRGHGPGAQLAESCGLPEPQLPEVQHCLPQQQQQQQEQQQPLQLVQQQAAVVAPLASHCSSVLGGLAGDKEVPFSALRLGPQLGEGGFGKVYLGHFRGAAVAIKIIAGDQPAAAAALTVQGHCPLPRPPLRGDEPLPARLVAEFRREVLTMLALPPHENVLALIAVCPTPPLAIVSEFCAGGSLYSLLHCPTAMLSWAQVAHILHQAAMGMAHLHEHNVLHRDLKSANLLLHGAGLSVRVADFGLARLSCGLSTHTGGVGTFQWCAPEVLASQRYSSKADVYSFGVVAWECCARQVPFAGMNGVQAALAVVNRGLRPEIPAHTPEVLAALIRACWAPVPEQRPTFERVVAWLNGILVALNTQQAAGQAAH